MKENTKGLKRIAAGFVLSAAIVLISSPALSDIQYIDNLDGTITDTFTGFTWIKDPNLVPELAGQKTWTEAEAACQELVYGGIGPDAWTLPAVGHLTELLDTRFRNPQINTKFFISEGANYWTQTPYN